MAGRWQLIAMILGAGLFPAIFGGQAPAQTPGIRPEDPRIAAVRNRMRSGALAVNRGDLNKLIQAKSPVAPPAAHADPAGATKPMVTPHKPASTSNTKPKATGPHDPTGGGSVAALQGATVTKPAVKDQKTAPAATARTKQDPKNQKPAINGQPVQPAVAAHPGPGLPAGYHPVVHVQAPGRLDWTFVVSRQSLDTAPTLQTAGYSSTAQSYELYIPPTRNLGHPMGMILHVSCAQKSDGWAYFQSICQKHGIVLAGVHGAGNAIPDPWRARIVLDVLDDVRRRLPIDPDRTYITGGSGAGHEACTIAHALPELFGGVFGMCGVWNLRMEQMPRQRMRERFSEAVITGAADFNRPELQYEFFPILQIQGIRSRLWNYPDMGHSVPNAARLEQVFEWMEAGLPQRRVMGALFPASRLTQALSPQEWSTAVLLEACQRTELPGGLLSGLFELQAVVERWRGLPASEIAQQLLNEFDAHSPVSSKEIFRAERLEFRLLQAKMFDGTLSRPPMPGYSVPRINLLMIGISLWQEVHDLATPGSSVQEEATVRLTALHKEAGR